jgi:C-terminal processing protease CtpA/Prc
MKKIKYALALAGLLTSGWCSAQQIVADSQPGLTKERIANMYMLCRVWGMLKYFHPAVAQGKYDWDAELFKELPRVNSNKLEFNVELTRWIRSLGPVSSCGSCNATITDTLLKHNSWIDNGALFNKENNALLRQVIINRNTGKNKYVSISEAYHNPDFSGEEPYAILPNISLNFRLLALFRFWNMVEYYFPYKNLIGEDWDKALLTMIPEFVQAETSLDYKLAVWRMTGRIHDTHANLYSNFSDREMLNFMGGERQLPVMIHRIEGQYVVAGLRDSINYPQLKLGDIILKVDGESIEERADKLLPYACASNQVTAYRVVGLNLPRGKKDTITLEIRRNKQTLELKLPSLDRKAFNDIMMQNTPNARQQLPYRLLSPQVGYVRFDLTSNDFAKAMFEQFKTTKGIVMDLRYYPALSVKFILRKYLSDKAVPFAKFRYTATDHPGLYIDEKVQEFGTSNKDLYRGKIVVLVNEESQSAAEFTAMALRAIGHATIMGSQTAGADGDVSMIRLPGGLLTYFSGIGVYYPDGKGTQRIGIVPDIVFKPTIKGLSAGHDELLEKAIALISMD